MLIHHPNESNPYFLLASVSAGSDAGYTFEEVSTGHIYCLDIQQLASTNDVCDRYLLLHVVTLMFY